MKTIKESAIHAIEDLPEDADFDDILEAIYIQQKITRGILQLDNGDYLTHDQVKERVKRK